MHATADAKTAAIAAMAKSVTAMRDDSPAEAEVEPEATESVEIGAPAEAAPKEAAKAKPALAEEKSPVEAAREAAKARRQEFETSRVRIASEYRAKQAQQMDLARLQAEKAALDAQRRDIDLAARDPFEYLRSKGKTEEDLVREGLARGSPEAKLAAQVQALEAKIAEQDRRQSEQTRMWEEQQRAERLRAYEAPFLSSVESNPDTFPNLAELAAIDPEIVLQRVRAVAQQYAQETGQVPPQENVLHYVEDLIRDKKAARVGAPGMPKAGSRNADGPKAAATLNGGHSANGVPASREMTREQRRELAIAKLKRLG